MIIKTGDSSTPVQDYAQQENDSLENQLEEQRIQRCKYCNKQFDFGDEISPTELCHSAPNKARESLDRFCCVQCYKGLWYHLSKDTLDDEGQDLGRCLPGGGMTTGYWCLLGLVSVICAPCLVLWCPLNICELAAQHAGLTGGPHNMTTIKKKTTMVPGKSKKLSESRDAVITEQPTSLLEPLTVTISIPMEDDEDEDDGYTTVQHRAQIPHVQRAQSEVHADRRSPAGAVIQRSMSESRG